MKNSAGIEETPVHATRLGPNSEERVLPIIPVPTEPVGDCLRRLANRYLEGHPLLGQLSASVESMAIFSRSDPVKTELLFSREPARVAACSFMTIRHILICYN